MLIVIIYYLLSNMASDEDLSVSIRAIIAVQGSLHSIVHSVPWQCQQVQRQEIAG